MNSLKVTLLGVGLLLSVGLFSQKLIDGKNFIGAKVLFLDYGGPNSVETDITSGLEVYYRRNINNYFAVGIPAKLGFIHVANELNNRNFVSIDAILRAQYYQPTARFIPYVFSGIGFVSENGGTDNTQIPVGGGMDIRIGEFSYINVQAEYRISQEDLRDNFQLGIGLAYKLGKSKIADADKDGIPDAEDACPQVAGTAEFNGCKDSDGDGIPDPQDSCPNEVGTTAAGGCPDNDGDGVANQKDDCPDVAGTLNGCPDSDGDGVADKDDECPNEIGTKENKGCPTVVDRDGDGVLDEADDCPDIAGPLNGCPDSDGDGVADQNDECPNEKGTKANGCPEVIDADGDGFADEIDDCPNQAGSLNGCPDEDGDKVADPNDQCPTVAGTIANNGCPEIKAEDKEVLDFAMRAVRFRTGSAILLRESDQILAQIASIMERYPDYYLQIAGHTDNVGNSDRNRLLSEDRAKACYSVLVAAGVSPKRLSFIGFGAVQPIGDNARTAGRALNRRVEFKMYLP